MTRRDIIDKVSQEFGVSKKQAEKIVKFIFSQMSEALQKGERITIQGFGSFEVRKRKKRAVYNPRTKEKVIVPEKRYVAFIPSKKLLK